MANSLRKWDNTVHGNSLRFMQKWQVVEMHVTIFSLKVDFTFIDRITTS